MPRAGYISSLGRFHVNLMLCGVLAGCAAAPPAAPSGVMPAGSPVVSFETQTLPATQTRASSPIQSDQAYYLGPNDIISISVYNHPELSVGTPGGGILITSDGSINLALLGRVQAGGMTTSQLQDALNAAYGKTLKGVNVTVQLVDAQSLRYYLMGAFATPGVKFPGRPMALLDALALGGSVDLANADLYQAYVANGSEKIPVDMHALLLDGDMSQNIPLQPGDEVIIPPSTDEDAFVFGAVGKPGAVAFHSGALSLLQALSESGLDLPNFTQARLRQVHLIRSNGATAQYYVLDATKILNGGATNFSLEPGDIIFVPPTEVASWNQVLNMLLPSLSTISGVLNPFVSIKYLSSNTNR